MIHEPEAICYTSVPASIIKLTKQRYRWDRSLIRFRLRRHIDLIYPSYRHFNALNALTIADNLLFNFLFNFKWWIFFFQILIFFRDEIFFIFMVNYLLYLVMNFIKFSVIVAVFGKPFRKEEFHLWIYIPLISIYTGIYLRLIRTYAHIMELIFKASYYDKWNPWKVSRSAKFD